MKTLLIFPEKAENRKNFASRFGLHLKKEHSDPIELVEISIELPITWERKLIDLNDDKLKEKDIQWADCVFIRAETGQAASVSSILKKCKPFGKKVIVAGSLFRTSSVSFDPIDHVIQNDAELPYFICDIENESAKKIYATSAKRRNKWVESLESSLIGFSWNLQRSLR